MKNIVLVFDFDGTIADTHRAMIEISNRLCVEFDYRPIRPEDVDMLKEKSTREIIQHLRVPLRKIPAIIARAKKELQKSIRDIKPVSGLNEILPRLKALGPKIGILSSNTKENILAFLEHHNLNVFDFINSTSKIWGKDITLRQLIAQHEFSKTEMIYIGDEIRDIAAARKLGIRCAAVTWGYNSAQALKVQRPDFLIEDPEKLLDLLR